MAGSCSWPQYLAIGANAGLPLKRCTILQQFEVLGDEVRHDPVTFLRLPLCAAGQKQGTRALVHGGNSDGDESALPGDDRRGFDEQFDGSVTSQCVAAEPVSYADELIAVSARKSLCAVLVGRIGLRNTKASECRIGSSYVAHSRISQVWERLCCLV